MKTFSVDQISQIKNAMTPELAMKIVHSIIDEASKSGNMATSVTIVNNMERTDGIPCLVCIKTPLFSYCAVPPNGDGC